MVCGTGSVIHFTYGVITPFAIRQTKTIGLGMSFISIRSWLTRAFTFCILLLVLCFLRTSAQVMQTDRFEVPVEGRGEFFDIIPSSEDGLYLHRHLAGAREDQMHLIRLDTAFEQKWAGFIAIEKNYRVMGTKAFESKLFMLLRYRDYTRNDL